MIARITCTTRGFVPDQELNSNFPPLKPASQPSLKDVSEVLLPQIPMVPKLAINPDADFAAAYKQIPRSVDLTTSTTSCQAHSIAYLLTLYVYANKCQQDHSVLFIGQ